MQSQNKKWRIVGFKHPEKEKSLVYYQDVKTTEKLLEIMKLGIEKGCNLFSIRGFES